ncbi:MAG TPA: RHS repeat-associated core domain-containing protein, partial [Candidatus Dormibacteraeota bacterium]|nr:RHS repeat-associated core domain-containing protein [Candidatus Dormibacteraeota bacterium]
AVGTTITDPDNVVTSQQYANGVLASVTRAVGTPLAATWSYAYDGSYNLATTTDPDNHAWRATWDAHGNQLTATDPLNRVTTWTYDALNDRTSVVDPLGLTTHYTYDARGNPTGTSRTLDTTGQTVVTTVAYDPAHPGDAITTTDADTRAWTYTYDASGNLVQVADSLGETTTYGYDAAGRRVTAVAPRGNVAGGTPAAFTTTTTVNAYGAPTQVRDAGGGVTVDTYDANQNLVSVRDPEGNLTRTTYDADNEPAVVTRADASTNRATYDADGNVTARTDGLGHSTTYTFDALGRLATTTDPLARRTSYQYDGAGNLTRVTNPAGMLETRSYDAANQLTQIAYSDGATATATFAYDADGQRRTMTDASGASTLRYDSLHRIISSSDGLGHGMAYTYDLAGHVSGLTYDPGTVQSSVFGSQVGTGTVSRSYDLAGRMSTVTDWLGHVTHFAYDADGNLVTQAYPNNTTASFTYDNADRLTGIADVLNAAAGNAAVPFLTFPVGRGGDGEVASANPVSGPAPTTQTYTHDPLGRLSGAAVPAGTQSVPQYTYGYDSADNLTQSAIGPVGRRYTYDLADELTAVSDATTGVVLSASTYDLMGNRVRTVDSLGNIIAMTYDQANRMVTYTGPPVTSVNNVVGTNVQPLTYVYDATGLRHWKTLTATGQMVAGYVYDLAEGMPLITSADQVSYVTGPGGLPLEQVNDAGVVVYYHQDALGSTRALTGQSGQVLTTYGYDPYGRATPSNTVAVAHFQWAGQYVDLDTGLQWMRARYYDPTTSQFTARDPLPAGVLQPYVYGRDDPVTLVDPTGLAATARGVPVGI